ncbi:MAG: iron uptake transporter permease EfeU [Caldilineaceae bacterium]
MLATSLIAFREGLEAALIISIVLGYLRKTGRLSQSRFAWFGVAAAVIMSILVALIIQWVGAELEGPAEQIFEGTTMLVAVGLLTWMIFWMRAQARSLKSSLEHEVDAALSTGQRWGLFTVTFTSVFREGVETALFLSAAAFATDGPTTVIGTVIGLVIAAIVGYLLYASTVRLNLRQFFNVTSLLLLIFAAGLFARGIHEFQEAGLIFTSIEHVWDTSNLISEESSTGQVLKTLIGYTSSPSLESVIAYVAYWLVVLLGMPLLIGRRTSTPDIKPTGVASAR